MKRFLIKLLLVLALFSSIMPHSSANASGHLLGDLIDMIDILIQSAEPAPMELRVPTHQPFSTENLPDDAILIEMHFTGLDADDERIQYSATSFDELRFQVTSQEYLQDVQKSYPESEALPYLHRFFGGAAMIQKDGEVEVIFADMNNDRLFQKNERLLPFAQNMVSYGMESRVFLTPDFRVRNYYDRQVPYRLALYTYVSGGKRYFDWRPCCIWKGTMQYSDQQYDLILCDFGRDAIFTQLQEDGFFISPATHTGQLENARLNSSLILFQDRYWNMRFLGYPGHPKGFYVVLEPCKDKIGTLEILWREPDGSTRPLEILQGRFQDTQNQENTIGFRHRKSTKFELPEGRYSCEYMFVGKDGHVMGLYPDDEKAFNIKADEKTAITISKPRPSIEVKLHILPGYKELSQEERRKKKLMYHLNFILKCAKDIRVGKIYGDNGETKPRLRIFNPDEEEVVNTDMDFNLTHLHTYIVPMFTLMSKQNERGGYSGSFRIMMEVDMGKFGGMVKTRKPHMGAPVNVR